MTSVARDPRLLSRLALAAIAAVIVVVVAMELHWVRVEATGRALALATRTHPKLVFSALRNFERAAANDPGTDALLDEAELLLFVRFTRSAVAPLQEAVRREPQNALAWKLLSQAASRSDPALAYRAAARALALNPPVHRPPAR